MNSNTDQAAAAQVDAIPLLTDVVTAAEPPARFDIMRDENEPMPSDWLGRRVATFRVLLRELQNLKEAVEAASGFELERMQNALRVKTRLVGSIGATAAAMPEFVWGEMYARR